MLTLCSPMLAFEMRTPIAVTETAEVTTGWGGGGEGVRTTRSAAGGARLYNLWLPTEGLRQGHGLRPYVGLSDPYLTPRLTLCWPMLPPSCRYVDPMLA